MSAPFANLNGEHVMKCRATIPYYGAWTADVLLSLAIVLSSPVTLSIGNLSLVGTVTRAATFAGARGIRIVGGGGGWRKVVSSRTYQSAAGVKISHVLGDAAAEVGEKISLTSDSLMGPFYIRAEQPAADLLRMFTNGLWWMDPSGTTQVAPSRPSPTVASAFQVTGYAGAIGKVEIATEDVAAWMPGVQFSAPTIPDTKTVSSVTHDVGNDGVHRLELLLAEGT